MARAGVLKTRRLSDSDHAATAPHGKPAALKLVLGRPRKNVMYRTDQRLARLPSLIFFTRKRLGLNLTDFGKLIGASAGRVAEFEAGRRMPNPAHMVKLAELMDLSPEALRTLSIAVVVDAIFRSGTPTKERMQERVVNAVESQADLRSPS